MDSYAAIERASAADIMPFQRWRTLESLETPSQRQPLPRTRTAAAQHSSFVADLHHPTTKLFVDIHQRECHALRDFVQRTQKIMCDDLSITTRELDILLTKKDVTEARAAATICIFCSKPGLHPQVDSKDLAPPSAMVAEFPTKRRSSHYLKRSTDETVAKGIRYTSAPKSSDLFYVVTNDKCIQFEIPAEASEGYMIPRWKNPTKFTEVKLRDYLRSQSPESCRLKVKPETIIIIPLRFVDHVRIIQEELRNLPPESLVFLSQLDKLELRDHVGGSPGSLRLLILDRFNPWLVKSKQLPHIPARVQLALLQVLDAKEASSCAMYNNLQQTFTLPNQDEEEKKRHWVIELIFPGAHEGSLNINTGFDVYASNFPSKLKSGFPFAINANFILESDENVVDFANPWNKGILDRIPQVFQVALEGLYLYKCSYGVYGGLFDFGRTDAETAVARNAYKCIPLQTVQSSSYAGEHPALNLEKLGRSPPIGPQNELQSRFIDGLETLRRKILENLTNSNVVMISSKVGHSLPPEEGIYYCKPKMSRTTIPSFREMLEIAHHHGVHASTLKTSSFFIVEGEAQRNDFMVLKALGVPEMSWPEYLQILLDENFLMTICEAAYLKLLRFIASFPPGPLEHIALIKHRKKDGTLAMASLSQTRKGILVFLGGSGNDNETIWLSEWTDGSEPWAPLSYMPAETMRLIRECEQRDSVAIYKWLRISANVMDLTVKNYAERLMNMLSGALNVEVIIFITQFLFVAVQAEYLQRREVLEHMKSLNCYSVVDKDSDIFQITPPMWSGTLLLPRSFSKWGLLLDSDWAQQFAIEMSANYFKSGPLLAKGVRYFIPDGEAVRDYRSFLRDVYGAVDIPEVVPTLDSKFTTITVEGTEKTVVLLKWLNVLLPQRSSPTKDLFLQSLKNTPWLKTVHQGMRTPSTAFLYTSKCGLDYFTYRDLPFIDTLVHGDLTDFKEVLQELGVVLDTVLETPRGCSAVARYLTDSLEGPAQALDLSTAKRLYSFLQRQGWKGTELNTEVWVSLWTQFAVRSHGGTR